MDSNTSFDRITGFQRIDGMGDPSFRITGGATADYGEFTQTISEWLPTFFDRITGERHSQGN
jgi:hypothetical protein